MVSIVAFQAIDPGSIPGQRNLFLFFYTLLKVNHKLHRSEKVTFCSNGMGSCQIGLCCFTCDKPLLAWVQGQMETWTWHG